MRSGKPVLHVPLEAYCEFIELPETATDGFDIIHHTEDLGKIGETDYTMFNPSFKHAMQREAILNLIPEVKVPRIQDWDAYLHDPRLPIVCRSPLHYGRGKWLLETDEQLSRLINLVNDTEVESNFFSFQEYIPQKSKHPCSIRVLANAAGELYWGYALICHKNAVQIRYETEGNVMVGRPTAVDLLNLPNSEYFLGAKDIRSNTNGEKTRIVLFYKDRDISLTEKFKLTPTSSGNAPCSKLVDEFKPNLTEKVKCVAEEIAKRIARNQNLFFAIDLIAGENDQLYWLETNSRTDLTPILPLTYKGDTEACKRDIYEHALKAILRTY